MTPYSGKLGFVEQTEVRPGVWEETVTEVPVLGKTEQRTETVQTATDVLPRTSTTTTVSVLARAKGQVDTSAYRYLTFAGKRLTITSVVSEHPGIVLYLGEVYRGPTP